MHMIRLLVIAFLFSAILRPVNAQAETLLVDGLERTYQVYVPSSVQASAPLVIVLHGGSSSAAEIRDWVNFDTVADKNGFIIAYPDGYQGRWNDKRGSGFVRNTVVDDVKFIGALIDHLIAEYPIDPTRIYVTGLSNGGFMSYQLACSLTDRFAGFAIVSANLTPDMVKACSPSRPLRMLIISGTEDPLIPYTGGYEMIAGAKNGLVLSTDETVSFWADFNQCTDKPEETTLPDVAPDDGTRVYDLTYADCAEGAALTRYRIEGGGHTWPDGKQYMPEDVIGRVSHDINGSEVIWSFFAASPETGNS